MEARERLQLLESRVTELSKDLRVLQSLLEQDHASALNKIRYVTEKLLHDLCRQHDVSWGKGEPTLENMHGPLRAKGVVPKHMAVHLRTIQTNASPGSHYQEDALGHTHVQVAQLALLEVLEWRYREDEESGAVRSARSDDEPVLPVATSRPVARRTLVPAAGALAAVAVAVAAYAFIRRGGGEPVAEQNDPVATPMPRTPVDAAPLDAPELALAALETYRNPRGSAISDLNSAAWWSAVARDFEQAAAQPDAPPRWRAGASLAQGFVAILRGERADAVAAYRRAVEIDPTWAEAQAALSAGLAVTGEVAQALAAAQEAQRLDPKWTGAVAATARVFAHANKTDEAIHEYRRALNQAPEDPVLLSELALVYHAARIDSQALRYAKGALKIDPDMASAHLLLAEQALEKNDGETALAHAEHAIAALPRSLPARLALADALVVVGRAGDARVAYEKLMELHADKKIDEAARMAQRYAKVESALAAGTLPSPRVPRRRSSQASGVEAPVRSVKCDPNDPLCGI